MGKIVYKGIEYGGSGNEAQQISYDNSASGLSATNVQTALNELASKGIDDSIFEEITDEEIDEITS